MPQVNYSFLLERIPESTSKDKPQETTVKDIETSSATEHLQTEAITSENKEDAKESGSEKADDSTESSKQSTPPKKRFHSNDPIHWYGILVPSSLRNAQRSFTEAAQSQVPELAGVTVEMRALEQQITKLRTELEVEALGKASSS